MALKPNDRYLFRAKPRRYTSRFAGSGDRYAPKSPDEVIKLSRDYSRLLAADAVIEAAGWDVAVESGNDATPTAMLSGSAEISGHAVKQLVQGGLEGVDYRQITIAGTEHGQREEQLGYLKVEKPAGKSLASKTVGEKLTVGVDFNALIPPGAAISSADWSVEVEEGSDATPTATLSGSAEIFGTYLLQLVIGGLQDVRYRHIAKATLDDGQVLHEHLLILVTANNTTKVIGVVNIRVTANNERRVTADGYRRVTA